tara:strand:- start:1508 stop:2149 length:642 start_codon:yes stop_codon:yes gene_type:complete
MNLPILYSFKRCPYAMRARMAIKLADIKCEIREVKLNNKPEAMLKASPKGTVPVLILEDVVIDESMQVIDWAISKKNIFESNLTESDVILTNEIIDKFDNKFKYHLDRYKYATRYENQDPLLHRSECKKILLQVNDLISDKDYFFGKELNKIDISILPFLRQFRIADIKWFDEDMNIPKMQKYVHKFLESKLLEDVMINIEEWKEGSDIKIFP